ncbi:hypothetical protein MSI_13250 [Treponema sp. JC4]|uniref:hypothetical protein n=1 Tax=Treponema sp. JC4 TaxID=1124982 RepID=UPI00025B0DFC|nr:hypothetical protein [Treponema sp. JC4]EID85200.1 hypothetical protein MSI_13250 [Treponema sp. JC4]
MTNTELKNRLAENGASADTIEKITSKYDFEEVQRIIDAASSSTEAFRNIQKLYPDFDADAAIKQMDAIEEQIELAGKAESSEGPVQLSADELDMVVGGGWWSDHWKNVTLALVLGAAGAMVGMAFGAAFGSMFGPVGIVVGLVAGTLIGGAAGGYLGWVEADKAK